jgi:hypothetical protein
MNKIKKFPVRAELIFPEVTGQVVEFINNMEGTVIKQGVGTFYNLGFHSSTWVPVTDSQFWRILGKGKNRRGFPIEIKFKDKTK